MSGEEVHSNALISAMLNSAVASDKSFVEWRKKQRNSTANSKPKNAAADVVQESANISTAYSSTAQTTRPEESQSIKIQPQFVQNKSDLRVETAGATDFDDLDEQLDRVLPTPNSSSQ